MYCICTYGYIFYSIMHNSIQIFHTTRCHPVWPGFEFRPYRRRRRQQRPTPVYENACERIYVMRALWMFWNLSKCLCIVVRGSEMQRQTHTHEIMYTQRVLMVANMRISQRVLLPMYILPICLYVCINRLIAVCHAKLEKYAHARDALAAKDRDGRMIWTVWLDT